MDSENKRFDLIFITENFHPEKIRIKQGESLFNEGENNDFVYFIEKGSIKVLKNKRVIGITKTMEFVGITSCISENTEYTFSARAIENSKLLKIKKTDFKDVLLKNQKFCKYIIEILCERIKLTDLKTRSFLEQSSQHRLINELISNSSPEENSIKAFLGIDDLSELTGASKRAVRKILNDLTKANLIRRHSEREIILLDQDGLRNILQNKAS